MCKKVFLSEIASQNYQKMMIKMINFDLFEELVGAILPKKTYNIFKWVGILRYELKVDYL